MVPISTITVRVDNDPCTYISWYFHSLHFKFFYWLHNVELHTLAYGLNEFWVNNYPLDDSLLLENIPNATILNIIFSSLGYNPIQFNSKLFSLLSHGGSINGHWDYSHNLSQHPSITLWFLTQLINSKSCIPTTLPSRVS
jgi:hypothetical protein